MDPQDYARHLPQSPAPGDLSLGESRAYELALAYPQTRGELPPFLHANELTEIELVKSIKWGVCQGNPLLIIVSAHWLALPDLSRIKLRDRLEHEVPHLF